MILRLLLIALRTLRCTLLKVRIDDFSIRHEQTFNVKIDLSPQFPSVILFSPNLGKLYIGNSIVHLDSSPIKVVYLPLPPLQGPYDDRVKFSSCGTYVAITTKQKNDPRGPVGCHVFQIHENGNGYTELYYLHIDDNKQLNNSIVEVEQDRRFMIETFKFDMHPTIAELVCLRGPWHSDKLHLEFIDLRTQPPSISHMMSEPATGVPLSSIFG